MNEEQNDPVRLRLYGSTCDIHAIKNYPQVRYRSNVDVCCWWKKSIPPKSHEKSSFVFIDKPCFNTGPGGLWYLMGTPMKVIPYSSSF